MDEKTYPNALEFDGFRFSRMREQDGESAKHHSSNTSHDFLYFGHGQHAWYPTLLPSRGIPDRFPRHLVLTLVPADSLR
jgi:hypothetical protein